MDGARRVVAVLLLGAAAVLAVWGIAIVGKVFAASKDSSDATYVLSGGVTIVGALLLVEGAFLLLRRPRPPRD